MNVFTEILLLFTFCPIYSHKSMRWVLYVFGVKKKKKDWERLHALPRLVFQELAELRSSPK